jgi:hypothetical protein
MSPKGDSARRDRASTASPILKTKSNAEGNNEERREENMHLCDITHNSYFFRRLPREPIRY